jgi:hypothetical protein
MNGGWGRWVRGVETIDVMRTSAPTSFAAMALAEGSLSTCTDA